MKSNQRNETLDDVVMEADGLDRAKMTSTLTQIKNTYNNNKNLYHQYLIVRNGKELNKKLGIDYF